MVAGKNRKTLLCKPFPIQIIVFEVTDYLHESRLLKKNQGVLLLLCIVFVYH